MDSLEFAVAAERATATFKVEGHLFDEKVINRIMDIVVDGPCTFEVQNLAVGKRNELHSQACEFPSPTRLCESTTHCCPTASSCCHTALFGAVSLLTPPCTLPLLLQTS